MNNTAQPIFIHKLHTQSEDAAGQLSRLLIDVVNYALSSGGGKDTTVLYYKELILEGSKR